MPERASLQDVRSDRLQDTTDEHQQLFQRGLAGTDSCACVKDELSGERPV